MLNHWGWVTHICVNKLTIICSDNGLSPGPHQAIIWTNAGILLIGPVGNFSEILIKIYTFSFNEMHLKMSSRKWWPSCLGLNVLKCTLQWHHNGRDGISNHQPHDCLLNCLFRHRSKKTSKLCITDLCVRNSPVTGEFPTQMASNAENVSIWWRQHEFENVQNGNHCVPVSMC